MEVGTRLRRVPEAARGVLLRHGLAALKAALAAVLSWLLARWLLPDGVGFYAPLVAVLSVHPTVVRTLRDAVQRLVAVGLGLGVGYLFVVSVGLSWWSLGAALVVSWLVSTWTRLGEEGVQVPVAALFLLLLAEDPEVYAVEILAEGVIGSVVGAAVNLALLPPLQLRPADQALRDLRQALGDLVDDMSAALDGDWPPPEPDWVRRARDLSGRLRGARDAVHEGGESTALNPRGRRLRQVTRRQFAVYARLEQVTLVVRDLAGTLEEAADPENPALSLNDTFRPDLAEAVHLLADALTSYGRPEESAEAAAERRPVDLAAERIGRLRGRVEDWQRLELPTLLAEGAVVTQLERAVRILQRAPLH